MLTSLVVLLVWFVLSVPASLLLGRAIAGMQERGALLTVRSSGGGTRSA